MEKLFTHVIVIKDRYPSSFPYAWNVRFNKDGRVLVALSFVGIRVRPVYHLFGYWTYENYLERPVHRIYRYTRGERNMSDFSMSGLARDILDDFLHVSPSRCVLTKVRPSDV